MNAKTRRSYRSRSDEPATEQAQLQIRLPRDVRRRLDREAARRVVSVNYLAEKAIESSLDLWEAQRLP